MATILKQTTQIIVRVGPFMDATDAVTPETTVALGTADQAEVMKAGGGASVDISGRTWEAVTGADGWYDLTLTTADTGTIGELVVAVQDTSLCLPVFARFQVIEEAVYDAMFAASADLTVAAVTGAVGSVTGAVGSVTGSVGSVVGHTVQTGDTYALANGATGFAAIDTVVDAIKVETDKLTFTVANQVDANVQSINDVTITGDGSAGDKFGV